MSDHHRSLIRFSLDHLLFLEGQIESIDAAVVQKISSSGYQQPFELLQTIPGIQEDSAASILAETGADMSVFPSAGHLSSWAGVCPGNRRSAGKDQAGRTTRGNRWLNGMLTQCAWAAASKKGCYFKAKFWRLAAQGKSERWSQSPIICSLSFIMSCIKASPIRKEVPQFWTNGNVASSFVTTHVVSVALACRPDSVRRISRHD